jgi:hypothetical protein
VRRIGGTSCSNQIARRPSRRGTATLGQTTTTTPTPPTPTARWTLQTAAAVVLAVVLV